MSGEAARKTPGRQAESTDRQGSKPDSASGQGTVEEKRVGGTGEDAQQAERSGSALPDGALPDSASTVAESHVELDERIRRRAHEIWLGRGAGSGGGDSSLEDWLQAEREVLGQAKQPAQDRGTVVGDAHRPDRVISGDV